MNQPGLGGLPSKKDFRTYKHETTMAAPISSGGVKYLPQDIENQHHVGICTAISLTQNAEKALGKKFSPDFQYLCQKKFYDKAWYEGSSIFNALKVGKNIGFLPIELFPYITEKDRELNYNQYVAKLQAIPDAEIERLKTLCTDKLAGYASVPLNQLTKGISDSRVGLLCRYEVGNEWWTPSWKPKDIDPLRPPKEIVSGHAINVSYFEDQKIELANTWGTTWNMKGLAHAWLNIYPPTEAWIPYYDQREILIAEKSLLEQVLILLQQLYGKIKGN